MVLATAGKAGLGTLQMERTLMRTCADANQDGKSSRKRIIELMVMSVTEAQITLVYVALTVTAADRIGSAVKAEIAMESADARPGKSARLSGGQKPALEIPMGAAHIAVNAASLGRSPIQMAQPLAADARTGGETTE
jgi:hypothetical protein